MGYVVINDNKNPALQFTEVYGCFDQRDLGCGGVYEQDVGAFLCMHLTANYSTFTFATLRMVADNL